MLAVTVVDLWLPIVLSAVAVWFASFLAWMVLPHHKKEWKGLPNEDAFLEFVRTNSVPVGQYMFPYCADYAEMKDPEKKKRWEAGPHGTMNVWSGMPTLSGNLIKTFLFYILVGVFVAYLASQAVLAPGAEFMPVFRFAGAAAVGLYALGSIPQNIWFKKPLRSAMFDVADCAVYGIITGVLFAVLWPGLPNGG